jgi:hypothetical protein
VTIAAGGHKKEVRLAVGMLTPLLGVLAACGGSAVEPVDISALRQSGASPAYWVGEEFEGLALTANAGSDTDPNFVYGTCDIPAGSDGGCAPPLQLQHWALADRSPALFEITPGRRTPCRIPSATGLTAAIFATTGGVEVYLGERVVVLFGEPALIRKAMRELRPVKAQDPALPEPPPRVVEQLRRCAPPSPELKLREWRAPHGPAYYWVGSRFEGHPLVTAEGDHEEARLVYGECAREELAFDAACWPPLEIRVLPIRSPASYAPSNECRRGSAQGAPTALLPSAHTLDVFAGDRTITLIGRELDLLRRAANALRPLNRSDGNRLPAPPDTIVRDLGDRCT